MLKKIKYLVLMIICMCVVPLTTHAQCDYQRLAELSRIASNVQFNYTYEMVDSYPNFSVILSNLTNDIYIVDNFGKIFSGSEEFINPYKEGNTITFTFYSNDANCQGEELTKRYVSLPEFNPRYNTDECKLYPEFSLCQMWTNTSFSAEQFAIQLENYKQQLNASSILNAEPKGSSWDVILSFLSNNALIFSIIGILVLISICILIVRKIRHSR